MSRQRLTDVMVRNLAPPEKGQITALDSVVPGLGVRVSQGGSKTFMVRTGKKRRRITIGRYPLLSLAEAREAAKKVLLNGGYVEPEPSPACNVVIDRYLASRQLELRPKTVSEYRRHLFAYFQFGECPVDEIDTGMVAARLDGIPTSQERAHAYAAGKSFFNWCLARNYCRSNPLGTLKKPRVPTARDRVLSDDELAAVWVACEKLGRYGTLVQVLMLTGQRRNQIAALSEKWVDRKNKIITFPASIMKNGIEHEIPLCTGTDMLLLGAVPMKGYYFAPDGSKLKTFSNWSKSKRKLDAMLPPMDPWTLHDLRRTWSTNAAKVGVAPHITDRALSHASGGLSTVARIYNRFRYQTELREAFEAIQTHVFQLLT